MATDLVPFKTSSTGIISPETKAPRGNVLASLALVGPTAAGIATAAATGSITAALAGAVIGAVAMFSPKIANQWERAVVLRELKEDEAGERLPA